MPGTPDWLKPDSRSTLQGSLKSLSFHCRRDSHFGLGLIQPRRTPMTKFALLGAAALRSAMIATPVTAQEVIYNPGYCAQFYPNANCQNKGPNNPYTGDYQRRNELRVRMPGPLVPARRARSSIVAATVVGT